MHLTHLGHSTVLLDTDGTRVLIDPGAFTADWQDERGLAAVLVTHEHADHLDLDRLPTLLANNPGIRVIAEPGVAQSLRSGAAPEAESFAAGTSLTIGQITVTATGGEHAVIHKDIPRIGNVGLLFSGTDLPTFYHPGDMLQAIPEGVDLLAVPIHAPWSAVKEVIDFVRAVGAPNAFGIHDALLTPGARAYYHHLIGQLAPETTLCDLNDAGATKYA